jgi:hypothetical protein
MEIPLQFSVQGLQGLQGFSRSCKVLRGVARFCKVLGLSVAVGLSREKNLANLANLAFFAARFF